LTKTRALFILVALVTLAACAPRSTPATAPGGGSAAATDDGKPMLLRVGVSTEPASFGSRFGGFQGRFNYLVNAFLARTDHQGIVQPYLTERLPSQDDGSWVVNPDGTMRTIWTLRPGTRWQDGEPLTAHDVAFAFRLYRDRELPVDRAQAEALMSGVVARDDRTVEINWTEPFFLAGQPEERDLVPLPRHLLEGLYLSEKEALPRSGFWTSDEYVSAGPYRIGQRNPGVTITFTANPHFILGKPRIETIEYTIIPDRNAMVARLLAGDIDFSEVTNAEQVAVLQEQWKGTGDGRVLLNFPQVETMIFQQRDVANHQAALTDVRVRRALVHAIDRESLALAATSGFSLAADTIVHQSRPLFTRMDAAAMKYPYDPRRAEQLVNEAGWTRGGDGVLRNAGGQAFDVEIDTSNPPGSNAIVVQDYWKRAGAEARLVPAAPDVRINDPRAHVSFPGVMFRSKPPFWYHDNASLQLPSEQNSWRGSNESSWVDAEYDALFARFSSALRPTERDDLAIALERVLTAGVGQARLYYNVEPGAARNNVHGIKGKSQGYSTTHLFNVVEWTVQ